MSANFAAVCRFDRRIDAATWPKRLFLQRYPAMVARAILAQFLQQVNRSNAVALVRVAPALWIRPTCKLLFKEC